MPARTFRIAVVSDVHAFSRTRLDERDPAPSFVEVSNPSSFKGTNPFIALDDLIDREELSADVLVSCGDMGDKAQPEGIRYTWQSLHQLSKKLGNATVIATSGNHDLDSRLLYTDFDARGTLLALGDFPFPDSGLTNEYWARNVVVFEEEAVRWVVLNSAAYHGHGDEYQHGRVAASTIEYLKQRLNATAADKLNILVVHHHVYKIGNIDLDDYSEMKSGSALLGLLESGAYGNWIVFHGHRHWPSVTYAPGGNSSPVVFAAGSLSAILWDELLGRARNQFYIVELNLPPALGRVRGTFKAWDFSSDIGFVRAKDGSGLPHEGGFGGNLSGMELASAIARLVDDSGDPFVSWNFAQEQVSDLRYALPQDLTQCVKALKAGHGLSVLEEDGILKQIGRL